MPPQDKQLKKEFVPTSSRPCNVWDHLVEEEEAEEVVEEKEEHQDQLHLCQHLEHLSCLQLMSNLWETYPAHSTEIE
jgi:hypothetical protein